MEIGLGEIVMIGILAVLLLEPKDLPRIAKKSARAGKLIEKLSEKRKMLSGFKEQEE